MRKRKSRAGMPSKRLRYCPQPQACTAPTRGRCQCQSVPGPKELHPQEYYAWSNMKTRCNNPNYSDFHRYGGRGIEICERWNDFEAFLADVGEKPTQTAMLDRIDNSKGYEPSNVRWASQSISNRNRDVVQPLTINGVSKLLPEWEVVSGRSRKIIWRRLQQGWPAELAVFGNSMPHDLRQKPNSIQLHWMAYQIDRRRRNDRGQFEYRMVDA